MKTLGSGHSFYDLVKSEGSNKLRCEFLGCDLQRQDFGRQQDFLTLLVAGGWMPVVLSDKSWRGLLVSFARLWGTCEGAAELRGKQAPAPEREIGEVDSPMMLPTETYSLTESSANPICEFWPPSRNYIQRDAMEPENKEVDGLYSSGQLGKGNSVCCFREPIQNSQEEGVFLGEGKVSNKVQ